MPKKGRLLGNGAREARKANAVDICSTIRLKNRLRTPVLGLLPLEYTISGGWAKNPITEFRPRSPGSELSLEERELEELLFQTGVFILSGGKSLEQLRLEEQLALSGRSREIVRVPALPPPLPLFAIGLAAAGALVVWLLVR